MLIQVYTNTRNILPKLPLWAPAEGQGFFYDSWVCHRLWSRADTFPVLLKLWPRYLSKKKKKSIRIATVFSQSHVKFFLCNDYVQGSGRQDPNGPWSPSVCAPLSPVWGLWSSSDPPGPVLWICESFFHPHSCKSVPSLPWSQSPILRRGFWLCWVTEKGFTLSPLRMKSLAGFYHSYISSNKRRILLTLGSTKFRIS